MRALENSGGVECCCDGGGGGPGGNVPECCNSCVVGGGPLPWGPIEPRQPAPRDKPNTRLDYALEIEYVGEGFTGPNPSFSAQRSGFGIDRSAPDCSPGEVIGFNIDAPTAGGGTVRVRVGFSAGWNVCDRDPFPGWNFPPQTSSCGATLTDTFCGGSGCGSGSPATASAGFPEVGLSMSASLVNAGFPDVLITRYTARKQLLGGRNYAIIGPTPLGDLASASGTASIGGGSFVYSGSFDIFVENCRQGDYYESYRIGGSMHANFDLYGFYGECDEAELLLPRREIIKPHRRLVTPRGCRNCGGEKLVGVPL